MSGTLSLIIPTYNRAIALQKTLEQIQAQTFTGWEAIVVDDGSTDGTKEMMQIFASDARIKYVVQKNGGPSAARNRGMGEAKGDVIVYCDSDDILYPHCLQVIADLYKDPAVNFSICGHRRTLSLADSDGKLLASLDQTRPPAPATLEDFYNWDIKTTSTGLSHRRAPFAGKIAWKDGFLIEDLELLMQLAVIDPYGFKYIEEPLLHYEQLYGGNGMCSGASYADFGHAFGAIYDLHKNDPLMKRPDVYLDRVVKYKALQDQVDRGEIPPPHLKYFPEFWTTKDPT